MELALHVHGRLVEGSALLVQGFAARFQQIKDFIDMLGLIGLIHEELLKIVNGHAGVLEAANRAQTVDMAVFVYALAGFGALHVGQQSLILVIAQRRGLHMELRGHLTNGVGHHDSLLRRHAEASQPFAFKFT